MSVIEDLDELIETVGERTGHRVVLTMSRETRQKLRDAIIASVPTVETDPSSFGDQVERYRECEIVVAEGMGDSISIVSYGPDLT